MDPPKEITMSLVTEDSVTISWIKPLAPFDYYKMSYQSARGRTDTTCSPTFAHLVLLISTSVSQRKEDATIVH